MSSNLTKKEGIYDPTKRGAFTNWSDEDFVGVWAGEGITIKPGQTVTLPEHLAIKFTQEFVDREMVRNEMKNFVPSAKWPTYEESEKTMVGIPSARTPYEKKTLRWLERSDESAEMQLLRMQVFEEVKRDFTATPSTTPPQPPKLKGDITIAVDPKGAEFSGVSSLK